LARRNHGSSYLNFGFKLRSLRSLALTRRNHGSSYLNFGFKLRSLRSLAPDRRHISILAFKLRSLRSLAGKKKSWISIFALARRNHGSSYLDFGFKLRSLRSLAPDRRHISILAFKLRSLRSLAGKKKSWISIFALARRNHGSSLGFQ
jgi:hypothetical protein